MRNLHYIDPRCPVADRGISRRVLLTPVLLAALGIAATGCAPDRTQANLDKAAKTLDASPDQAITASNAYLMKNPNGPDAARAWYVKGRAYEERTNRSSAEAQSNLRQAREAYERALVMKPTGPLEGLIRSGLANVAYFQEDFTTAVQEWTAAFPKLSDVDNQAWTLYRIGLCQQRLGRFDLADRSFARVQSDYPGTTPAQRSAEKKGYRQFFVQLGVYDKDAYAAAALQAARKAGVPGAQLARDNQGRDILRAGPTVTYAEAKNLKTRIATRSPQYAQSMIVP